MSEQEPTFTVRKIGYTVPVSAAMLYDAGAITLEEALAMGYTPPPPPTRRQRRKWAREEWWYKHKPHLHFGPCDTGDDW